MSKILVAEISGKRAGDVRSRPTEKFTVDFDHLIISNNSKGYITDWDIVNVPDDYVEWYKANVRTSENAWYAPMNRSYAIKYAREHGYDYLVQLDDNIRALELAYKIDEPFGIIRRYRYRSSTEMMNEYIEMLACVLDNTNACMAGCGLAGSSVPDGSFLKERYCYSFFCLNVHTCPDIFHGDFEDDIEFRLKCQEKKLPTIMVCPMLYSKTGQVSSKDETGNRAAYTAAGLGRGDTMRKIHGDVYSCGYAGKTASTTAQNNGRYFKHKIKPFKVGAILKNKEAIEKKMLELFRTFAQHQPDKVILKEKGSYGKNRETEEGDRQGIL